MNRPALALLVGSVAAGLLSACGAAPSGPARVSLLSELQVEAPAESAEAAEPALTSVGGSFRRACRTADGRVLVADLPRALRDTSRRLELAAAALRPADGLGGPADIVVEAQTRDGEARELLADRLYPADGWVRYTVELAEDLGGELRLRSGGRSEVAWSDLSVVADRPSSEAGGEAETRPNLILISLDTVRADHLSLYGYPRATSPNLDRFAADAWVFPNARSTSTWTLPTHATMFTGLLPDRHGLQAVDDTLAEEAVTVAETLAAAGYTTAAITDGGFLHPHWGFAQGFERYDVSPGQAWSPKDAAAIFGSASRWLRENGQRRPFFLFVHSYEAHQPYVNRDRFADPFLDPDYDGPFENRVDVLRQAKEIRPRDHARIRALYDGGIRRLDHHLGMFLRELQRRGFLDNTAVLITSDHGEEFGEHGGWEHVAGKLFEENVRVPMVLRLPGGHGDVAPADRFPRTPVSTLDVVPTLLELAAIDGPVEGDAENGDPEDRGAAPGGRVTGQAGRSLIALAEPAAAAAAERTVLLHGLNSVADLPASRYRLDRGYRSLLFDELGGSADRYDRRLDPAMRRPLEALGPDGQGAGLIARLQTVLAWLDAADFAVRLPLGTRGVEMPADSGFSVQGSWSGVERHGADTLRWPAELPATLLVSPREGGGGREIRFTADAGDAEILRLEPLSRAEAFHPLDTELPPPGTLIPGAERYRAVTDEPEDEQRRQLEALGYL